MTTTKNISKEEQEKIMVFQEELRKSVITVSRQAWNVIQKIPDFPLIDFGKFIAEKKMHVGGSYVFEYLDRYYPSYEETKKVKQCQK